MENPIAKFELVNTFVVTNRGLVFSGLILEGEISSGCFIKFNKEDIHFEREIMSIEFIRHSSQLPYIGLVIKCENENEIKFLKEWNPISQVVNILKK